ncbi:MAG: VWA domain-containing protein [Candidatus Aminicenantes bacterium]|nr:VWA domain-containing protein [Candidatus Aminicenantes bacterium]
MRKQVYSFLIALIFLFCALSGSQKQQKLPPEKHEVEVRLVLVDVIVTKDGEFVTDLAQEDFELYEDEREVPINSFELVSFEGKKEVVLEEEPEEEVVRDIPKKQLVVVFDGVSSWQRNLKEGARKIVDELVVLAEEGNEVMVIQLSEQKGIEILQNFTTEEELLRKALIKASGNIWFDDSADALRMWQEVGIEDVGPMAQVERYTERLQPVLEQEYLYIEKRRFEKALGGIFSVANMIKDLPGRKSILLISDGFPDLSSEDRRIKAGNVKIFDPFNILGKKENMNGDEVIRELIRFSNAQNISIYSLDPDTFARYFFTASAEYGPRESMDSLGFWGKEKIRRVQNLSWISEDTAAVSLKGAKKYDRFRQVMRTDLNYYYQLSFYPRRKEPDNEYHKIRVKVKRSGVDVSFRKGYTDYSEGEEERILLVSAFYNPSLYKKLPFEGEFVLFHNSSDKYEPWMNVALPVKELFRERGMEYGPKKLDLHVWIKDKKRGENTFGGQITIPLNISSSFMEAIKTTDYLCFHYRGPELDFNQRDYQAVFGLFDPQTNEIGTWESTFVLPDLKHREKGNIINCVLGFTIPNPEKGKELFSISKNDGSLEYGQIKFYPAVTNRFQRMQNASIFLQVYVPEGKAELHPKFEVSGEERLTQEVHGEMVAESWNEKSNIWSALFDLNLSGVIFGDYILKIDIPLS